MVQERHELEALNRLPGMKGVMLSGRDGLLVESTLERARAEALSALVAAAFGAATALGDSVPSLAEPEELFVEAEDGTLQVLPSGAGRLLAALFGPTGNLGMIRLEMRQVAARLAAAEQ